MFDIGFWELVLVGLVALIVVGPERLPEVARALGSWAGKAHQSMRSLKQEFEDELHAEELRRSLAENLQTREIQDLIEATTASIKPSNVDAAFNTPVAAPIDLSKKRQSRD
ncbi:MAG: Sec-independent protein translocase protein TatB [Methylococcales bacterium]